MPAVRLAARAVLRVQAGSRRTPQLLLYDLDTPRIAIALGASAKRLNLGPAIPAAFYQRSRNRLHLPELTRNPLAVSGIERLMLYGRGRNIKEAAGPANPPTPCCAAASVVTPGMY